MIPIAFYAPLKSPDHAVPSGDRTMGRLLRSALRLARFEPELASEIRSLDIAGDPIVQRAIKSDSEDEADDLIATLRDRPVAERPRLWFTYHCHYKAPDWIGPRVAVALGIPYVVAEGSRSARRAHGPWALGHAGAEAALDHADCLLVMNPADAEDLVPALRAGQDLVTLPPFLDAAGWPEPMVRSGAPGDPLRLLTVAMMRAGDKLSSYRLLAEALARLPASFAWTLDIVGDGPAAADVVALFARFGTRIRQHGLIHDRSRLAELYGAADLLVWPAIGEAYGMTLLEAQACGCPILAGREGGVPAVVQDGRTGVLVAPRDAAAFAEGLTRAANSRADLARMRERARRFVRDERDLPHAAAILRAALAPLTTVGTSPEKDIHTRPDPSPEGRAIAYDASGDACASLPPRGEGPGMGGVPHASGGPGIPCPPSGPPLRSRPPSPRGQRKASAGLQAKCDRPAPEGKGPARSASCEAITAERVSVRTRRIKSPCAS